MNPNAKTKLKSKTEDVKGFKCTLDGVNWTFSSKKKCRYCTPVEVNDESR